MYCVSSVSTALDSRETHAFLRLRNHSGSQTELPTSHIAKRTSFLPNFFLFLRLSTNFYNRQNLEYPYYSSTPSALCRTTANDNQTLKEPLIKRNDNNFRPYEKGRTLHQTLKKRLTFTPPCTRPPRQKSPLKNLSFFEYEVSVFNFGSSPFSPPTSSLFFLERGSWVEAVTGDEGSSFSSGFLC